MGFCTSCKNPYKNISMKTRATWNINISRLCNLFIVVWKIIVNLQDIGLTGHINDSEEIHLYSTSFSNDVKNVISNSNTFDWQVELTRDRKKVTDFHA